MNSNEPYSPADLVAAADLNISRDSCEPVYSQVASILRKMISDGSYLPGAKIPSELAISRQLGISPMTVRQAVGILSEEGLLQRMQGRGTFVKSLNWHESGFSFKPLADIIDSANTRVRITKMCTLKATAEIAARLNIKVGERAMNIVRILERNGMVMILQQGYLIYDPGQPLVEAELDVVSLAGLFSGAKNGLIKKAELEVSPKLIDEAEANCLKVPLMSAAFAVEYTFYDFKDAPIGCGSFIIPRNVVAFKTKIGLWDT